VNVVTQHISKTPDVCGGKACIAGRRIRVLDVVALHEHRGYSPDEIVNLFVGITLADVYAALAYYFDNRDEIDADFRKETEIADSLRPIFPSKLQEKLRG
jgi:uncharacterized protein (DUF433 family)